MSDDLHLPPSQFFLLHVVDAAVHADDEDPEGRPSPATDAVDQVARRWELVLDELLARCYGPAAIANN